MVAPYSAAPPGGAETARAMLAQSVPLELVQASASTGTGASSEIMLAGGLPPAAHPGSIAPPGVPFQPLVPAGYAPGAVASAGALTGPSSHPSPTKRTEVRFLGPDRMKVSWYGSTPDGRPALGYIVAPGRYNFVQAAAYRLRLSDIPSLPGVDLYPTLEVVPANARTEAFLAHSAVPVSFTNEDFEQVQAGNYLVKVIYLPNPQFQDIAAAGPDEIVSSRLEPGADPIAEAHRRGNILLVIRLGNIDLNLTNSPALDAPSSYAPMHSMAPGTTGQGRVPGMPMPFTVPGGQPMTIGPNGQMLPMPNTPMMGAPGMMQGVPAAPATGQAIPLSQLPDTLVPQVMETTDAPAGATPDATPPAGQEVVITSDMKPAPKRHWWWPWGGSDK
jgi:hypothetical protein